jgi:hypothetical protein
LYKKEREREMKTAGSRCEEVRRVPQKGLLVKSAPRRGFWERVPHERGFGKECPGEGLLVLVKRPGHIGCSPKEQKKRKSKKPKKGGQKKKNNACGRQRARCESIRA